MPEESYELYVDRRSNGSLTSESQYVVELLRKNKVPFKVVESSGKVRPELKIGEKWITGKEEIEAWLKERKKRRK
ncbi:MAG: hypothetical protein HYV47_00530 [Candidatus Nealsonbacteria bacterium]|nr:hypothetical protein [Candidatus Nealsonbacteria bacterium]